MSASITLSGLSWSTPDGRPLFSSLDLSFVTDRTGLVGRNGVGKTTLLRLILGEFSPSAGRLSINGTLGALRQTVQVGPDDTVADLFEVRDALALLRRAEDGQATVDELGHADWTLEARLAAALDRLALDVQPETPLASLSGGQRTRLGLAALLFAAPDFILLDEPTNNLDREGRRAVIDLLANWRAGAIVISHDRELLDTMDAIVELTSLGVTRYGGNWSHYRERKALELAAARHDLDDAEKRLDEVARRTQERTERQARRDRAGRAARDKGGAPRIALNARKAESENTSGAASRLADRQQMQAQDAAASARRRIEVLQPLSVVLPSTDLPATKTVLRLDQVTAGYDPDRPVLSDLSLSIVGPERIAVTGPNGRARRPYWP